MRKIRVSLVEQSAELERVYRDYEAHALVRYAEPVADCDRREAAAFGRRLDALRAAWTSLAWLAEHPSVLAGYLRFAAPLVAQADDWPPAPSSLEND